MQMADLVSQETELSYFVNKPVSIFRTYSVGLHQFNNWDYGMNYLNSGVYFYTSLEFLNKWVVSPSAHYLTESLDNHLLRGGKAMLLPSSWEGSLNVRTDNSKKIYVGFTATHTAAGNDNYRNSFFETTATVIPFNVLKLSVSMNYSENADNLQYVDPGFLINTSKIILAHLDQKTLGATFRIDYNITPELSLQYYGSPFASVGKYSALKEVTNPIAGAYSDRFSLLNTQFTNNAYQVEAANENQAYSINNPDFTFNQFRSNLVFRLEYRPGSQLFLVCGNERTDSRNDSSSKIGKVLSQLSDVLPNNIFLIKLNYWFSL